MLGAEELNNEILVVGKPTTQHISDPPFQNAKETIFKDSGLSKICDALLRQKLCVPFNSDCLIRSFEKNEAIALYSNHNWTYLQSRIEDKMPSDGVSLDNTCEHGFTEKYRLYKENLLKRKLKMIEIIIMTKIITKRIDIIDNKMNNNHLQCVEMIKKSSLNDL